MLKKWTHPGVLILAGFVAMVLFVLIIFLSVDDTDFQMVTDDYFAKEETFQDQLNAEKRTNALGNLFEMKYQNGQLQIQIPSEISMQADSLSLYFYNVSKSADDRLFGMPSNAEGTYVVDCEFVGSYPYYVTLDFHSGDERYFKKIRLN